MTREEAICFLDQLRAILLNTNSWLESTHQPITDAFSMAIDALKQYDAIKDCRNCKYGKYNDYLNNFFCYSPDDCNNWEKWEADAQTDIYPLTIIRDRYRGVYSGGQYTAWNLAHYEIPEDIGDDDTTCRDFWNLRSKEYPVGVGDTIREAVEALEGAMEGNDGGFGSTGR